MEFEAQNQVSGQAVTIANHFYRHNSLFSVTSKLIRGSGSYITDHLQGSRIPTNGTKLSS